MTEKKMPVRELVSEEGRAPKEPRVKTPVGAVDEDGNLIPDRLASTITYSHRVF